MNYISKVLLTAALGTTLLALEACRKWDTNRLEGRWKLSGGDVFFGQNVIFDFEKDGDFTEERVIYSFFGINYLFNKGDWKWISGKKLKIDLDNAGGFSYGYAFNVDREFEVILIQGNEMELEDDDNYSWEFKRE